MTKAEEKKQLRTQMRALEKTLSPRYKAASDRAIVDWIRSMPEYQEAEGLFCFVGTAREINTRPLLEDALAAGKRLCVPLCVGDGQMELRQIRALDKLAAGAYGILEPLPSCPQVPADAVDLAVIPCLSCNHQGHRLGQGGGFYDRFLSTYRGAAVLVCREKLIRDEIPREPHDLPIPWVVTEAGLFEDGTPSRLL